MANEVRIQVTAEDEASGKFDSIKKNAGKALAGVGVAAAGAAAVSLKEFGAFEEQMNEVFTLLPGISDGAMKEMEGQVKDFSKEFGVLPKETVPALYQALSAGVPKDNVFEFLETSQKAAKGGVTDLETAVDGITSVVNAYGEDVIGAGEASDKMFTAVKNGKTNFEELSGSLFNVIPTASSLGVEFGDVTAAMATMTSQGTPTSVATTQLRQALVEASKGGTELDGALKDLHGKGFADLIKDGMNTGEIFDSLRQSMPEQEFKDLFGSVEAMNAALAITGPNADSFSGNLDDMKNSAGATDEAFQTMDEGMNASMDKIKANLSVLALEVGEKLAPAFAAFTDWILETAIPALENFAGWFGENVVPKLKEAGSAVGAFVQEQLVPAFETLTETVMPKLKEFGAFVQEEFAKFQDYVDSDLKPAFENIKAAVQGVIDYVSANWETIMTVVQPILDTIIGYADLVYSTYKNAIGLIVDLINGDFAGAWDKAKAILTGYIEFFTDTIGNIGELIKALAPLVLEGAKLLGAAIWDGIKAAIDELVIPGLKALPGQIQEGLGEAGSGLMEVGGSMMSKLWEGLKGFWSESVVPWFASIPGKAGEALGDVGGALKGKGGDLVGGIKSGGVDKIGDVLSWFGGIATKVAETIGDVTGTLASKGKDLITGLFDGTKNTAPELWDWYISLPEEIATRVGPVLETLLQKGKDLLTGLLNGVKEIAPDVWSWYTSLPGEIVSRIGDVTATLLQKGKDLLHGLFDGVTNIWENTVSPWFVALPGAVTSAIGGVTETLLQKGKDILQGMWDGITEIWSRLNGWLGGMGGRVSSSIPNPLGMLLSVGKDILQGLWDGMSSKWSEVTGWLGNLNPANYKGPAERDKKMLLNSGHLIMDGLREGLANNWSKNVVALLKQVSESIQATMEDMANAVNRTTASIVQAAGKAAAEMKSLVAEAKQSLDTIQSVREEAKGSVAEIGDAASDANDAQREAAQEEARRRHEEEQRENFEKKKQQEQMERMRHEQHERISEMDPPQEHGDIRDRGVKVHDSWYDAQAGTGDYKVQSRGGGQPEGNVNINIQGPGMAQLAKDIKVNDEAVFA